MAVLHGKNYGKPTLDLNFAGNKSLIDTTTGRNYVTFTRAQSGNEATYVGSDGLIKYASADEPRFDHDPETLESLGLLVEESRTNFITRSEELDDIGSTTGWLPQSSSVFPNAILSPDGNTTADKLVESNLTSEHYINTRSSASVVSGNKYTISIFAKPAERSILRIAATSSTLPGSVTFDLINQTFSENGAIGHPVQVLPNGWYRCSATFTASASSTTFSYFYLSGFYAGDGTSGMYLWGAQLEAGSFPTSYIPTSGSTETRAADEASITGTNFSSWYNQSEGTISFRAKSPTDPAQYPVVIDDSTNNNRHLFVISNSYQYQIKVSGSTEAQIDAGSVLSSFNSIAGGYKTNDIAVALNGSVDVDNVASIPTCNRLSIYQFSGVTFTGTISRITYYPKRLPDIELQQLTK